MSDVSAFYQICSFRNPTTKAFHVRKFVINNKNEFANVKEYFLSRKQYKKLLEVKTPNEYKCFNTYDLKNIAYPTEADILVSKSQLLNNSYNYTGYAPF